MTTLAAREAQTSLALLVISIVTQMGRRGGRGGGRGGEGGGGGFEDQYGEAMRSQDRDSHHGGTGRGGTGFSGGGEAGGSRGADLKGADATDAVILRQSCQLSLRHGCCRSPKLTWDSLGRHKSLAAPQLLCMCRHS